VLASTILFCPLLLYSTLIIGGRDPPVLVGVEEEPLPMHLAVHPHTVIGATISITNEEREE
jgi:hypothetical protein